MQTRVDLRRAVRRAATCFWAVAVAPAPLAWAVDEKSLLAPTVQGTPAPEPDATRDQRRTLGRLPVNWLRNIGGLASRDNAAPFLVGGGLTGLSFTLDDRVRAELKGRDLGGLKSFGDKIGDAEVVISLTAGLFVAGRIAGNRRFGDMTYDLAQAQLVVSAIGVPMKSLVGRERPNGSDNRSFPSGHSYSWFAIATVIERHYGIWASLPAFGLWALSSLSRIANDAHYFSDMIGGAALGYLVARTTKRVNDAPLHGGVGPPPPRLQVTPWIPSRGRGVGVVLAVEF